MKKENRLLNVSSLNVNREVFETSNPIRKKRKFSLVTDDSISDATSRPSKIFKKALFSEKSAIPKTLNHGIQKLFHYKSTRDYTKVVAKPGSLPTTPKIFKDKHKDGVTALNDSFLYNLLSFKSFGTNINKRFRNELNNTKTKEQQFKKTKKLKNAQNEEICQEKLKGLNKKKQNEEKKIMKKQKEKGNIIKRQEKKQKKTIKKQEEKENHILKKQEQKENQAIKKQKKMESTVLEKQEEKKNVTVEKQKKMESTVLEKQEEKKNVTVEKQKKMESTVLEKQEEKKNVTVEKQQKKGEKNLEVTYKKGMSEIKKSMNVNCKKILNCVDLYKVSKENALIFHMHYPSKFSFHGEIKLTIISGEVEILGYTLNSSSSKKSADVYSPNFCIPLLVETKPVNQGKKLEDLGIELKNFLTEEDYNILLTKLKPEDSILMVEQIVSNFGIVINKYFDKPLFSKDLEDVSSLTETLKSLQSIFTFKFSPSDKYLQKSPQWDKIPLGHCTALCGGKGVGKSTLLKYYINKLVALGEKVLCIDLDPGQPEFTYPGCVSAVVIDKPLLGPNFTHVTNPVLMLSFGNVDVSMNPSKYLECVKYVIESCKKNEELLKMKWFVNTMGFCKGVGVELMTSTLKLLEPNTVIQIKCSNPSNNYPFYLNPQMLNSKRGFLSMPLDGVNLSYDFSMIHSCAEFRKKPLQGGLKQKQLRDIMSISYFSQMVSPPFYNFNAVQPYLISFSKLYLGVDFLINLNDILKAFNGSTVSLSHVEPDTEDVFSVKSEGNDYFKLVVKPSITPSLAIGFVRGIDCREKNVYVITHLPTEVLANVNCLSLGRINPPHSMFLKQKTEENQIVYTTLGTSETIKRIKRMFRMPGMPLR